jgi:hypothetical protein
MKISTKGISASMNQMTNILDSMELSTEMLLRDASSFASTVQDEISRNAIELTSEILGVIKKTKEIIAESGKTVMEGTIMIDKLENRAKDMKGKI